MSPQRSLAILFSISMLAIGAGIVRAQSASTTAQQALRITDKGRRRGRTDLVSGEFVAGKQRFGGPNEGR